MKQHVVPFERFVEERFNATDLSFEFFGRNWLQTWNSVSSEIFELATTAALRKWSSDVTSNGRNARTDIHGTHARARPTSDWLVVRMRGCSYGEPIQFG